MYQFRDDGGGCSPKVRWTSDLSTARGILVAVPYWGALWAAIILAIWLST
jgi:hypothetical protein